MSTDTLKFLGRDIENSKAGLAECFIRNTRQLATACGHQHTCVVAEQPRLLHRPWKNTIRLNSDFQLFECFVLIICLTSDFYLSINIKTGFYYYFDVCTVHLVQIIIQTNKCTTRICMCVCVCVCVYIYIYIFIHLLVCLTTGPKPPLKRFLHIVRSRASSFK